MVSFRALLSAWYSATMSVKGGEKKKKERKKERKKNRSEEKPTHDERRSDTSISALSIHRKFH
jgi:hypothetical protein